MMKLKKRFPEWLTVVRVYQQQRGPLPFLHMLRAILAGPVPRYVWRHRLLRGCNGCPVFDRSERVHQDGRKWRTNACAGPHGTGCGCWTPAIALFAPACWMHTVNDGQGGWPEYRHPTIWHRLWAPIRFLLGR